MVLEKTLENPFDSKRIKTVNPKGNQPCIFIGRTDAKAEVPILWPPDVKNQLTGKNPDAGKDWRQEEKGTTEDEMVGWHHHLNGHEFEQALGVGDGQGSLVCYSPLDRKESDMTEQLNRIEIKKILRSWSSSYIFHPHFSPVLWPPDAKNELIGKDPDAGKDWGQKEKGATDEMAGWHHWFNECEFEQILGDSEGPGSLVGCSPWGHKDLDMTVTE